MRRFRRGIPIRIRKKGFSPAMRLITQLSLYKIAKLELETKPESGKTSFDPDPPPPKFTLHWNPQFFVVANDIAEKVVVGRPTLPHIRIQRKSQKKERVSIHNATSLGFGQWSTIE